MCQYIKDNGEQCGMDTEPFCRHHDDTEQANNFLSQAEIAAQSDPSGVEMDTTCSDCESRLRRTERLRKHPNMTKRLVFEAVVECDCSEYVLGSKSVSVRNIPDGWYDD